VLRARLLGGLEVELDGVAIESPATQRPWAVFAYVALAGRPVSRAELANTFWPDVFDQSARASVRSALWALRRRLGDAMVVDGEHVRLRDGAWIDVAEFDRLAADDPDGALALCRAELLEGIDDEWAVRVRERHRERVIELLERQARDAQERGDERAAVELTRRQVERDRFDEGAHRRLMRRLADAGDRAGALRTYRTLAERLRRELAVAPSGQTRELADELRADTEAAAIVAPAPPEPGLLPLVGREPELAALEQAWRAAAGGSGCVAVVRGEAGIGKTRLATELRLRASESGARTAWSAALDLGGTAPFSLWAELIRELLPSLPAPPAGAAWPDDLAMLVSELPAHFARSGASVPVAPDLQRTRLFEAVVALLGWAARDAPLLLVLEDAHDADVPSLELAAYAARRVAGLRMMILITRRVLPISPDADRLEHALRSRGRLACELDLKPLAAESVAALACASASLSHVDVGRVVQRADGNPLLAVETARALAIGGEQVPASLRASVRATVAPLSGDVRGLVEIAAVAARPIEPQELDQLSLQDAAAEGLQTGLLSGDGGRIAFRHALLREAAYHDIAEPRRRGLHRRWAQALIDLELAGAEVARHLRLARVDAEAIPHLARAAAEARALGALEQAVAYVEEALELASDRSELWLELAELEAWRGRRDQSEDAFGRAFALLEGGEPLILARAWLQHARANHGPICSPRVALESARTALGLIEQTRPPAKQERAEALAACAWCEAVAGSVEEAERLLDQLSAGRDASGDLRIYDIAHARALALMRHGRFVESYEPSIAAGVASDRIGRPDLAYAAWVNAAGAATAAGQHERALEFLDRAIAAVAGRGLKVIETDVLAAMAFVLRRLGRLEEARRAAQAEQAVAEELAQPDRLAMASHDRGLVALEDGDYELAAELLGASLVDQAPISRPVTRIALAEALARGGQPERAADEVRAAVLEPVRPSDFPATLVPRLARVQGLIALARGDLAVARRRIDESIAGWERLLAANIRADSLASVLADLGRPVVGLVEPEHELQRARADLAMIPSPAQKGCVDAVVP
jgi:DNA-binding SARP family transcriptional activator